jgi:hypothetical protein
VVYKKLAPRKPIGMKKLNKKTKKADAICAARLLVGKLEATAKASMHIAMPNPLNMKSFLRPKRSIVKKATKHERNFQVNVPPDRIRDVSLSSPNPCWKMIYRQLG